MKNNIIQIKIMFTNTFISRTPLKYKKRKLCIFLNYFKRNIILQNFFNYKAF